MIRSAALAAVLALAAGKVAGQPVLSLPIDCVLGDTCHIQQFVDRDPGAGATDFRCGTLSYDGHKGTDFALRTLLDMKRGVDVLSAAPGVVRGTRNSVPDRYYGPDSAEAVKGRECGNGVVIRHEDGWETQYCHMRQGSIRVREGDRVDRGTVLGHVGLSGRTQFPHLHLSVRHKGEVIDPFDTSGSKVCGVSAGSLWQVTPNYVPGGLIDAGFAPAVPEFEEVKAGTATHERMPDNTGAIVLFAYAFGGLAGDKIQLQINGPDGPFSNQEVTLERNQAQFFRASGRRLSKLSWPTGTYTGMVTMWRNGELLDQSTVSLEIE